MKKRRSSEDTAGVTDTPESRAESHPVISGEDVLVRTPGQTSAAKAKLAERSWLRYLFITVGILSLVLGIVGVVTPVLPTTPFILLSGYCFARGSERFHDWIMGHRYFGPMIKAFRDEKRIPLKAKILATVMITVTMSVTAIFFVKKIYAIVAMATVGLIVVTYIWTFRN